MPPVPPVISTVRSGSRLRSARPATALRLRQAGDQQPALAQGDLGLAGIGAKRLLQGGL